MSVKTIIVINKTQIQEMLATFPVNNEFEI